MSDDGAAEVKPAADDAKAEPGRGGSAPLPAKMDPPPGEAADLLSKVHMFEGLQPGYLRRIAGIGSR